MTLKQWAAFAFESITGWVWHRKLRRETGEVYMDRWQLLKTRPLSIYINRINMPDYDELLHNHPWPRAYSLKLRGTYVEELPSPYGPMWHRYQVPSRLSRIPELHRITHLRGGKPVWTLFVGFNKRAEDAWGFMGADGVLIPSRTRRIQRGVESEQ